MNPEIEDTEETEVTEVIETKEMFAILKNNYTDELHAWMKTQFSDVCSNMDKIINNMLDKLNKKKDLIFEDFSKYDQDCIIYIYDFYIKNYIKGDTADPFWAD